MSLKKINEIKQNKYVKLFTSIILVIVFVVTIGYSGFSNYADIKYLLAEVRIEKNIRVTGVSYSSSTEGVVSKNEDYNVKNIYSTIALPNEDSTVTYRVEITNLGNIAMGIYDITSNNENIEISLSSDYQLKEKICVEDKCTLGIKKYIDVTIKYKEGAVVSGDEFNVLLTFDFRPFYTVNYEGFEEDTSSYTQEVIEGDNLKVEFNDFSGKLEVYMDNALLTPDDYTFTNNVLELKNVTGNITVKRTAAKTNPLYAFMQEKSQGDDKDFDFHNPNFVKNGVFMNYETKDKDYPVYYYRGDVNNSIIYANHCWQIVRTTQAGGLKIVYDGEVKDGGQCTDSRDRLGSESYNVKPNNLASPSQVGYMYGEIRNIITVSPSRVNDIVGNPGAIQDVTDLINNQFETRTKIIAGDSISWDGESYHIQNSKTYTSSDGINTARLLFKEAIEDKGDNNRYTCISENNTCEKVYYLYKRDSETVHAVILESGETDYKSAVTLVKNITKLVKNQFETGTEIIAGDSISWNNGSYQIQNSKTYTTANGIDTARLLFKEAIEDRGDNNRYTCISSSNTCDTVYYLYKRSGETVYAVILKNGETSYESILAGKTIKIGTVFGNNVTYDETTKKYTLKDTITVKNLDELEDDIRGGESSTYYGKTPDAFHYTCLTNNNTCENVYYIYYNNYGDISDDPASDSGGLFGIKMNDGKNVTQTLKALLDGSTNDNDSHAKAYIDEWFQGKGNDFKAGGDPLIDHIDELEDTIFCNDRTVAGYHGWDINADNHDSHNKYLHFDAFKRIVGEGEVLPSRPRLSCDIKNDAFTVENPDGNQKLTYPIALLDADEAVLAGAIFGKSTNTYLKAATETFLMSAYYISDDHIRMFAIDTDGSLDDIYASSSYGIRPAIALKPIFKIASGDGSSTNPYTLEKLQ